MSEPWQVAITRNYRCGNRECKSHVNLFRSSSIYVVLKKMISEKLEDNDGYKRLRKDDGGREEAA